MNEEGLKLTMYFGERDRAGDRFLADACTEVFARHELKTSLVLRGTEGFGARHALRTDRLLSLSEDLPVVGVAVDTRPRIEQALAELERGPAAGLVTLERARLLTGRLDSPLLPPEPGTSTKLTVYVGRRERAGGSPAFRSVVDLLHRRGVAGATVLLGVDGTAHGVRRRARFLGRNADVPLMVIAVGDGKRLAGVLPELGEMLARPLVTLERVHVLKRDGRRLAEPPAAPETDAGGPGLWQKLTVYADEQARHGSRPLHQHLVRALRESGAAGATSLRGVWGFHGDHAPHGDTLWQLRRRVPILTVLVDRPAEIRRWFRLVDVATDATGLVTCETVPAYRAGGAARVLGGLSPAAPGHPREGV